MVPTISGPVPANRFGLLRAGRPVLKVLGSLVLTVVILVVLVTVLFWGTFLERFYGDTAAKFGIYGSWWFNLLGALLGLNSLAALIVRLPWRLQHLGFVVPHVGLIVMLIGCYVSRQLGVEATVSVPEGQSSNLAYQGSSQHPELDGRQFFVLKVVSTRSAGSEPISPIRVPFTSGPFNWADFRNGTLPSFPWALAHRDRGVIYDKEGIRLEVLDYLSNSTFVKAPSMIVAATPLTEDDKPQTANVEEYPFTVESAAGHHGLSADRPYGFGSSQRLRNGVQIRFWMTGSEDETDAFRQSKPSGPLGKQGRITLYHKGTVHDWPLDEWTPGARRKLGDSGLEAELVGTGEGKASIDIFGKDGMRRMVLSAEAPHTLDQQDYADGVFGAYWPASPEPAVSPKDRNATDPDADKPSTPPIDPAAAPPPAPPRVDFLLGADQELYLRTCRAGEVKVVGPLKYGSSGGRISVFRRTPHAAVLVFRDLEASDRPGFKPKPLEFDKDRLRLCQAQVRLTVDGRSDEFWISRRSFDRDPQVRQALAYPPEMGKRVVAAANRRVELTFEPASFELRYAIHVQKAWRKLDPGTQQPSFYGSEIDLVPTESKAADGDRPPKFENLLVTLNAPLDFADSNSGKSFRLFQSSMSGPFPPEDLGLRFGEPAYVSGLTLNYDPGRGLTYVGCLLIVAGIFLAYFIRFLPFARSDADRR